MKKIEIQFHKNYQIIKITLLLLIVLLTIACCPEGSGGTGGY